MNLKHLIVPESKMLEKKKKKRRRREEAYKGRVAKVRELPVAKAGIIRARKQYSVGF